MRWRSAAENRASARLFKSMKLCSKCPDGIDLDREPAFGEVDLHVMGALRQAASDLRLVLAQQIMDELLARVSFDIAGRIHQAQRGW